MGYQDNHFRLWIHNLLLRRCFHLPGTGNKRTESFIVHRGCFSVWSIRRSSLSPGKRTMRICFCWAVLSRYTWVGKNPVIFPMHSSLVKAMYPVYIKIFAYAYLLWKLEVEASTNSHWNNFEKMFQPLPALARPRAPGGIWLHGPWLRRNGQMNWCESKLPGENPPNDDTPTQIHGTNMSECYLVSHLSRNETFSFREGFAHTITSWREELLMSLSLLRLRRFDMSEGETWREPGILFFWGGASHHSWNLFQSMDPSNFWHYERPESRLWLGPAMQIDRA